MTALIPAPHRCEPLAAPPLDISSLTHIACDPALTSIAVGVADRLAAAGGPRLEVSSEAPGVAVRLRLDPDAAELADLPRPVGEIPSGDDADERYALELCDTGVEIVVAHPAGLARAEASLIQLVAWSQAPQVPALAIRDVPRVAWRGLSLDVVRRFFTPAEVCQVIDLLAIYKFNVLHLHLSDDQGWRIAIDGWPHLTGVGAKGAMNGRPGGFYSHEDYAGIVAYAAERHLTIVPEIDMPGHCTAVLRAYPHLAPRGASERSFLDAANRETYEFVADVFGEVADLTPGPFLHLGGDEPIGMEWADYRAFLQRALPLVRATGKRLVAWQEVARGPLVAGDLAQYWIDFDFAATAAETNPATMTPDELAEQAMWAELFRDAPGDAERAAKAGARLILSPQTYLYLDTPYAEAGADEAASTRAAQAGARFYVPRTVRQNYEGFAPDAVPGVTLDTQVAGVEAAIWCETVESLADLQFLVLPRLAGVAQQAWTAQRPPWEEHRAALASHGPAWERTGWDYFRSSEVW